MSTIPQADASKAALTSMERHIDQLPLLPQVLVRIMQVNPSQDDYFERIADLAREDPPFAVRLITMANSPSSAPVSPIKSIKDALTRVGAQVISSLVSSLAVQRVFVPSSLSQLAMWRHSIRVGVASEVTAQIAPELQVDRNQAYLAGLLHDIGRFVMFEHAPEQLRKVDESNWHSPQELVKADVEIFKYTHAELGFLACRHWGLPDELAQVIRRHHEVLEGPIRPGSVEAAILCIEVADLLDVLIIENADYDDASPEALASAIEEHCLPAPVYRKYFLPEALAKKVKRIRAESAQLLEGLGLA